MSFPIVRHAPRAIYTRVPWWWVEQRLRAGAHKLTIRQAPHPSTHTCLPANHNTPTRQLQHHERGTQARRWRGRCGLEEHGWRGRACAGDRRVRLHRCARGKDATGARIPVRDESPMTPALDAATQHRALCGLSPLPSCCGPSVRDVCGSSHGWNVAHVVVLLTPQCSRDNTEPEEH